MTGQLLGTVFVDPAVDGHLEDARLVAAMLQVEAELVLALARLGLVPADAAEVVAAAARALRPDPALLGRRAQATGNPVPPLVDALTAAVPIAARPWVHHGATSQDIVDSALVLTVGAAARVVAANAAAAADRARALAAEHRDTLTAARTLGRHAVPTTVGLRAAGWSVALGEASRAVAAAAAALPVQLGGAAGTLAAYADRGLAVRAALADRLGLPGGDRPLSWHTDRTPWLRLAAALGEVTVAAGKVAVDVRLLVADEVSEVVVAGGGSSAMPQKQNPVEAVLTTAAAVRGPALVASLYAAAVGEHERAAGAWHAEWEPLRQLTSLAGGAGYHVSALLGELRIDADRCRRNLDGSIGAVMAESVAAALAPRLGRDGARLAVRRALRVGGSPRSDLLADPEIAACLDADALDRALDPRRWLGTAGASVDIVARATT